MNFLNIPEDYISLKEDDKTIYNFNLTVFIKDDKVKFSVGEISTSWMDSNDGFLKRIQFENLNPNFLENHLSCEIKIKNILDRAIEYLECEKYPKAIECFDEVLYYDPEYGEALFFKSKAIYGEGHFVKALRAYKKAIKADDTLGDVEYHKLLLKKSSAERDAFPKIKRNIYAGDEYFAKGDYQNALKSYNRALENPTNFKTKIHSKLLNKKATSLLKLDMIDDAMEVFRDSISIKGNDYAYYNLGIYADSSNPYIKMDLRISKRQLLVKAKRLIDFAETDLAKACLDEFFSCHYMIDDDYDFALGLKNSICS